MEIGFFVFEGVRHYFALVEGVATRAVAGIDGYWYLLSEAQALEDSIRHRKSEIRIRTHTPNHWGMSSAKQLSSGEVAIIVSNGDGHALVFSTARATAHLATTKEELLSQLAELDAGDAMSPSPM